MRHTTVADVISTNVISPARRTRSHIWPRFSTARRSGCTGRRHRRTTAGRRLRGRSDGRGRPVRRGDRRWWRPRHIRRAGAESKAGATTVRELMTTGVETVTPSTRVTAAARTMMGHHLSWMPVCDETGHVAGVLSRSDVLTVFLRDDASIRAEIVDDVVRRILL